MYLNKYFDFNLVAIILYLAYETLVTCLCSHLAKQVTLVITIPSTTVVFFTLESKSFNCTHSFPLKYHLCGTSFKIMQSCQHWTALWDWDFFFFFSLRAAITFSNCFSLPFPAVSFIKYSHSPCYQTRQTYIHHST